MLFGTIVDISWMCFAVSCQLFLPLTQTTDNEQNHAKKLH